ncbi:MAG: toll/interleukin-1 receptor domain-containing protein [Gammaproteobacteria bacterium]
MSTPATTIFVSYSRDDSQFAVKLASDLKAAGADAWLDELDIPPGARWDRAVEKALESSTCLIVILSPSSVASDNVMDEVSFAIDEKKAIVPVVIENCRIPLRMRRFQYIDFSDDYTSSLRKLLSMFNLLHSNQRVTDGADESACQTDLSTIGEERIGPSLGNQVTSVLSTLSKKVQLTTVTCNGHKIEIGMLHPLIGQDTVWYDGKEVSKKLSKLGSKHSFHVVEGGGKVFYEVIVKPRWHGGKNWVEVKRNGEVVFNDRN